MAEKEQEKEISQELKDLVLVRLQIAASDRLVSFGGGESYTSAQLIEHVEKEDDVGRRIVNLERAYLNALKSGEFNDALTAL